MTYKEKKDNIREEAISWQHDYFDYDFSYGEISEIQAYFEKLAKRYGLIKEFKENWII